jgi:hypothetical protein
VQHATARCARQVLSGLSKRISPEGGMPLAQSRQLTAGREAQQNAMDDTDLPAEHAQVLGPVGLFGVHAERSRPGGPPYSVASSMRPCCFGSSRDARIVAGRVQHDLVNPDSDCHVGAGDCFAAWRTASEAALTFIRDMTAGPYAVLNEMLCKPSWTRVRARIEAVRGVVQELRLHELTHHTRRHRARSADHMRNSPTVSLILFAVPLSRYRGSVAGRRPFGGSGTSTNHRIVAGGFRSRRTGRRGRRPTI